ncbi:hypothetical protein ABPG72_012028 [Tetrahymena utriculariae]
MDEEDYQNSFKTQGFSFGQNKAIILNENSSYQKDNNKKKQCIKNCSFKKKKKNANYEGIKIIQTIGKRYLQNSNEFRCKFKSISSNKLQLKTKAINDYVSRFFETTFEKTFLNSIKAQDFSTHDQRQSHEFTQKFKSKTSAISGQQIDQGIIMQCSKFELQECQTKPSLLGQYQQSNIHQIVQQQIVDINNQSSISYEIDEKSDFSNKRMKLGSQGSKFANSIEGHFVRRRNSDKTQYELVIQSMFDYLEQIKQNFECQLSITDNLINQGQAKSNSIFNSNVSIINKQMLNPQIYDKGFESFLPSIQLKCDQQNKFKDYVIKIFNSFILRGRERRQCSSASQQQMREDIVMQNSKKTSKKSISQERYRKDIDSYDSDSDDDDGEEEDNEQYINEKDSSQINYFSDKNNQFYANKGQCFQTNFERPNQVNLSQLECNIQPSADGINKNQSSATMSIATQPKNATISQTSFQLQNTESSLVITEILIKQGSIANQKYKQANEEPKSEKQQKMLQKSRKNSISSPQQNMNSQQSKYHNLKNSFMHLIIQVFTKEVLSCFELPSSYLDYSCEILERMKNYSFKYRPVKGRYQYYSNIHYSTLFLKLNKNTLGQIQQCAHYIQYHKVFFNEDISNCQKESDFALIKCNFYKILIGQIVLFTLQNAEDILLNEIDLKNNQNYLDSSRFNYISKVKKGIQKLQRAKHAIRF